MKSSTTNIAKKHEVKNTWFIILCLLVSISLADASNNDKIRLVQSDVSGSPALFSAQFAVRDTDGLSQQDKNGHKYYVRWNIKIYSGTLLKRTLSKDEQIVLPFTWIQLPKHRPPDDTCAPDGDGEEDCNHGTEPFVQVLSTMSWDGDDENGNPIPPENLNFRIEAQYIRIKTSNGQLTIISETVPHCGTLTSSDQTPPIITIAGVEEGIFYAVPPTVTITIQDPNLQTSSILLDGQPFVNGTTVTEEGAHNLTVIAVDTFGNKANAVVNFGVDTILPEVTTTSPKDGDLLRFSTIQVNGTLIEANLKSITINGNSGTGGGEQFFGSITLHDGSNTIVVVATDLAGNTAQDSITVTLDQTAPGIAISDPQNGAVLTDNLIDVTGAVSGNDIDFVTVNGVTGTVAGNDFTAQNVLLSSGLNTIHAIVRDQAGNTQEATIQVTLDIEGPSITFTKPVDNSVTTADSTPVSGFVFDLTGATLTINDANVALQQDGSFQTTLALNEGPNPIAAVATDQNGNSKTAEISITRDSTPPTVLSIIPADGSTSVPVDQIIEIQFSESVKSSTVNSNTITFQSGGNNLQATLQTTADRVILTPAQPLTGANTYTVTILPGIADLAGNVSQTGASSTFSTFDTVAPAPPVIDPPLPQVTSDPSIIIAGTAEARSLVEITGGVARVTTTATDLGTFSGEVSLFIDAVNQISITAKDLSGNISNPTTATILQDSIRMAVIDAAYQIDGTILIDFSKAVDLASITPQNLYIIASGIINGTVSPTANPATILFAPDTPLGSTPFLLKVETSIRDQSGQPLEYAFSKIFNAAGGSFVLGEVYDNFTGLPLPGAIVRQISPVVTPAPEATSDSNGQFTLPVAAGNLLLRIERAGYLSVDRFVSAPAAQAVSMFDARLQPQDSALLQITNAAATLLNSDGGVSMNVVAGTVSDPADVRLTSRDGQSLPQILPEGWSPVGVATIDTQATPQLPFTLRVRNEFQIAPNTAINTAYFDAASSVWKLGPSGAVSADGQTLEVEIQRTGTHAFLVPDFNNPPPPPILDQPLQPSPPPQTTLPGTPSFTATPEGVYPDQRARVDISFTATQFRSGTKYQAIISENYKLLGELGEVITIPRTADLIGYSNGQISSGLIRFYAAPAKAIDFSQLDTGFINVAIHPFPDSVPPGGIIGEEGGTVNSAEGDLHLTIPPGALTTPVPVSLTWRDPQSVQLPLQNYNLITAFEVSFSGAVLLLPAVLDGPASLPANPQLVLARLVQVGLSSYWVMEGTATYDGNRIITIAGPASAPGIRNGGIYGIFHAQVPIGFLTGLITNPQSNPAGPGIIVSSSANPFRALTSTTSLYTLSVPVGLATATANNSVSGDSGSAPYNVNSAGQVVTVNIQIVTTPPQIVSITPTGGATNVPQNTTVRVTFSESVLASSVNSSSLFLKNGGANVAATILLTSNNTIAILTPTTQLAPNTQYTLTVTNAIKDLTGNSLSNPVSNHVFTTIDNTPPDGDVADFKLFLPEGANAPNEGIVKFEVDASQIESGISLVFFNDTQQTSISATLQNGKYTASLAGRITDAFFVMLIDGSGNQTRVDLPLMQYPDGKGAAFKAEGGTFVTSENVEITIQPGTFDSITPVRLETVQIPEEELPPHDDYVPLQHFTLNLNGATAKKEIEIAVPVPNGITEDSQVFVMKPVEFFSRRKWMAMEIMKIVDGKLRTQSPPWPGIQEQAITSGDGYSITAASVPMYFLSGSVGSLPAVLEFSNSDLAILLFNSLNWILPLQINEPYTLTVSNPVTGETLFEGQPAPPATEMNGVVQLQKPVSPDNDPPYVIAGNPLTFVAWRIGAATGLIRNNIAFAATDSNSDGVADIEGTIVITGTLGALSKNTFVAVRNNRTGQQVNATAATDGVFETDPLPYKFADPITVLLSSTQIELNDPIRLQWNEPLHPDSKFQQMTFCELDASNKCTTTIPFTFQLLSAQTLLEIKPIVALESDKNYRLELKNIKDLAEIEMPGAFELRFRTHDFGTTGEGSSGVINDTFLLRNHLLVAKDTGIEVFDLANPFSVGTPVATMPLVGGVRSFARLGSCTIGSLSSTDCIVVVGGGVGGHSGLLRILDFQNLTSPSVMKDFMLSRFVGDPSDDPPNGVPNPIPEGRPIKVLVNNLTAYVANIGVGVQIIDLTHLDIPVYSGPHSKVDEPNLKDVAIYMKESPQVLDVLLAGLSMHSQVDVDFDGDLDTIPVSFKAAKAQSLSEVTRVQSGVLPGIDNNLEVFQDFEIEINSVKKNFDLAFIGSGSCGIHVLDVTCLGADPACTSAPPLLGTIYLGTGPTNGGCGDSVSVFDLKLDRKNKRLYVPAGGAGIYIVDVSDPFLINKNPPIASQVIGRIEFQDGTIADGEVTIDEELNTVYVATKDGFKSVLTGNLQIGIFTDSDEDGQIDDQVGFIDSEGIVKDHKTGEPWLPGTKLSELQSQDPIKYYVIAYLPSAAGADVKVHLQSTNFFDQPLKLAAGFPATQMDLKLHYQAVSDEQQSYRLYRSDAFYITAHPLLPAVAKKENPDSRVIAAGDLIKVLIDSALTQKLNWVNTDLLQRSVASARAIRLDYIDSENPEPKQNPAMGSGETAYPPYLHSGEFTMSAVDLSIKGRGFDYVFTRKYESQSLYDGPLGVGWDHLYNARILELPSGHVFYFDGMGRKEFYRFLGEDDPRCTSTGEDKLCYLPDAGNFVLLAKGQDGLWQLQESDGTYRLFDQFGRLEKIQDRYGNRIEMQYNPQGRLDVVVDTMGRPITYKYNDDGKLISVRDFSNPAREWKFNFDENVVSPDPDRATHLLTSVETPKPLPGDASGRLTRYEYQNVTADPTQLPKLNLSTITDPRGNKFLQNTYDLIEDQLTVQQYGKSGENIIFNYQQTALPSTVVTDRRGTVTEYEFGAGIGNNQNNLLTAMTEELESGPLTTEFISYDAHGLLLAAKIPGGDLITMKYQGSEQNLDDAPNTDFRNHGNLLESNYKGVNEGGGESQNPLKNVYVYSGTFNVIESNTDPGGHVTKAIEFNTKGSSLPLDPKKIQYEEGVIEDTDYNDFGQLIQTIDGEEHKNEYEYYPETGPATVRPGTDPNTGGYLRFKKLDVLGSDLSWEYFYDIRGNVIEIKNPRGFSTKFVYNALDELIERIDGVPQINSRVRMSYDKNGNLTEVSSERELEQFSSIKYEYGILNQLEKKLEQLDDRDLETIYLYDANYNLTEVTYPQGNKAFYVYDKRDDKIQENLAPDTSAQQRTFYNYDKNRNLISIIDDHEPPHSTVLVYDNEDRHTATIYSEGNVSERIFNADGLVTSESVYEDLQEQEGDNPFARIRYEYDALHRLNKKIEEVKNGDPDAPLELQTTYSYNQDNLLTAITDPKLRTTTIAHDGVHREIEMRDPAGNTVNIMYGDKLNATEIVQSVAGTPGSHISNASYHNRNRSFDALNRLIGEEDDLGHRKQYAYDFRGNLNLVADPVGVTAFSYDDLNRKRFENVTTGNVGEITKEYRYDDNSRLTQFIDARSQTTNYSYDEADRIKSIEYPSGAVESMQYDTAGNLKQIIDRNLSTVTLNYDANERLSGKVIVPGVGVGGTLSQDFGYDAMNRMISASDEDSNVQLTIDSRGLIWRDNQKSRNVASRFDQVSNKIRLDYPDDLEPLQRQYHTNIDRLLRLGTNDSSIRQSQWLGTGRETDRIFGNGIAGVIDYDVDGRLSEMKDGGGKVVGFGYQWDDAHFRTTEILRHHNSLSNTFNLDRAHRINNATLQFADKSIAQNPNYDRADNIISVGGDDVTSYLVGPQNQYVSDDDEQFAYDANGNLTSYTKGDTTKQYTFDYSNRMISAQITRGSESHSLQFEYDPLGRRTARVEDGNRSEFIYDGEQIVQERNSSGDVAREFVWGDGIDELVAIRQDGNTYYSHENSIGSIAAITDHAGKVIERYDYDLFGAPVITQDGQAPCVSKLIRAGDVLTTEFCEEIDEAEVSQDDIKLFASSAGDIPFTFVFEDGKLIVTPSQSLPNEPITIQVSGVADLFGNVLVSPFNQTFNPGDQGVLFSGGSDTGPVVVEESTIGNPFLFQGREWDPVAGLYYYRARYYDPHLMRFLSVDPLGYHDSPNLYQGFLNNPMNFTDPTGEGGLGDFYIEQEIKKNSPEYIKQWQETTKMQVRQDAICSSYIARYRQSTGRDAQPGDLIYGSEPEELYIWYLSGENEGRNCSFSHEIGITPTGHEFIVASAATVGVRALAMGATTRSAVVAAADEFAGQVLGINPSSITALVRGTKLVLQISRKGLSAEQIAAIEYKYAIANKNVASGQHPAQTGSQIPYRYHRSKKFVRDSLYPEQPIKNVRVPGGYNVDEIVARQFGGPQVSSNQQLLFEDINKMLGSIEYQAARGLPKGTVIQGFIIEWVD